MKPNFKPTHYTSLSPYLIVNNCSNLVGFLTKVFKAKELRRYDMPDGTIGHIEVQIDDSVVMLGDCSPEFPAFDSLLHVYVQNVDEVFDLAIQNGATIVKKPMVKEGDSDRRGSFKDPSGNTWAVATQESVG